MRSLRGYLIAFVLAVVLPGLSFGLITAWQFAADLHRAAEDDARHFAHAAAETMTSHLREQIMALTVLARVPTLVSSLDVFYQVAEDYHNRSGYHVTLSDTEGNRLLSTRRPYGTPLPPRSSLETLKTAVATNRPVVSNLVLGRMAGELVVSIDIPLPEAAGLRVVSLTATPLQIADPLRRVGIPMGWRVGLLDGRGSFIYYSVTPEQWIGRKAHPELAAAIAASGGTGQFDDRDNDGALIHHIFERLPDCAWTVMVDLPEAVLYKPLWGPLTALTVAAAGTLLLTVLVAVLMGRPLQRAARRLTEAAEALGRGEEPQPTRSLAEFDRVSQELTNASALIQRKQSYLAEALVAAERANDAKSRFLASVSHDLRQPLMAQRLLLGVAAADATTPTQVKVCGQMETVLAATETMLSRLMDFAALETGNVDVRREAFPLDEMVRKIVEENDEIADEKGLAIGLRTFPCWTESDPVLLGRILRNLITNAVRYTERGGLLVGIRRRRGLLRIEVWDTGRGIAEENQRAIFEEFRQLDNPERNRTKGQGLGLAIVARTADLLGHRLSLRSTPGRGSVFAIEVPALPPPPLAEPAPEPAPLPSTRILLVEDDEVQASALATVLRGLGHRVTVARDAATALAADLTATDLILTDYRLPGSITGIDLVVRARHTAGRPLPALVVTGDAQRGITLEAAAIGCEVLFQGNRVNRSCGDEGREKVVIPGGDLATEAH